MAPLILWLLACGAAEGDCATREGRDRDACWYEAARTAAPEALPAVLDGIDDPVARDLVLLRLAVDHPERANALCAQTKTPTGREKCDKVIGRPHLSGGPR